jgi:hypothetical protein
MIVGLLATATTLLPLAAAGSQSYDIPQGQVSQFSISGTLTSPPVLSESEGVAVIQEATFHSDTNTWTGEIRCVVGDRGADDILNDCDGTVSS